MNFQFVIFARKTFGEQQNQNFRFYFLGGNSFQVAKNENRIEFVHSLSEIEL